MTINVTKLVCLICFVIFPVLGFPTSADKEICFNFYIVTKAGSNRTESNEYEKQKKLAIKQISQTEFAFESNKERNCPDIKFSKGLIEQITWRKAIGLSLPVDKEIKENYGQYLFRKTREAYEELEIITKKIKSNPNIKYAYFLDLHPGRVIAKTENALNKYNDHRNISNNEDLVDSKEYELKIKSTIDVIKLKLDSYGREDSSEIIKKAKKRLIEYNKVDESTAITWSEGELTLWNDIEVQNTSVELKNLLKHYRADNQCLDVYIIPAAKSPSTTIKEVELNGKWTKRDGAAISSKNFPRTTAGKGNAILLTYNSKPSEFRLAHELGHLLLDKPNAHLDKKETDLMHEFSKGGYHLDETECEIIKEKVLTFYGGKK